MSNKWPKKVVMYTDGASRGNPGPASVGVHFVTPAGKDIDEISENIGFETNNFAEYYAVILGLKKALENDVSGIHVISDSEFLIKQLKGEYKVKSENIIPLYQQAKALLSEFDSVKLEHVLRDKNKKADKLANEALDSGKPSIGRSTPKQKSFDEPTEDIDGIELVPLTMKLLDGYREVLDEVAREKKYLCFVEAPSRDDSVEFLERLNQKEGSAFVALDGEKVVGWCDISRGSRPRFSHTGSLGMGVSKPYRGKGIGEALIKTCLQDAKKKNFEIVTLSVFSSNQKAIGMYEKLGFKKDGTRKDQSKLDGHYEDMILMSIKL